MSLIYILNSENKAKIFTDYNGNIFLQHNEKIYTLFTDFNDGLIIMLINNTSFLEENYKLNINLNLNLAQGKICPSNITLKGKIYEKIKNDKDENIIEHTENEISICDEKKYYWVSKNQEYEHEDEDEDEISNNFMFNSISDDDNNNGILYAKLLFDKLCTFDTILIENKNVLSSVEKIDGYINSTLVINTNGTIKISFVDKNINGILIFDDENKLNFKMT